MRRLSDWRSLDPNLLRQALATPAPLEAPEQTRCAAVSILLNQVPRGVELLLIRRSIRASDPWSGHMALPGGHREPGDATLLDTAIRETREEVGIDLSKDAALLGTLDDVAPVAPIPILVRPFVFALERVPPLSTSPEVDEVIWANLADFARGTSGTEYELLSGGQRLRFPGYRVGSHVVWGLTYRVLGTLLRRTALGRAIVDAAVAG